MLSMSTLLTKLRIRFYGDSVLRKRSVPVERVGEEERTIFTQMEEILQISGGVGLAAPQVGLNRQMIVVDVGQGPLFLANPRILKKWGTAVMEEGCLSLPGIYVKVKRARKVRVSAWNEKNEKVLLTAEDLLARVLQHEIDHLRARLIFDHANFFEKIRLKKKLRAMKLNTVPPAV